MSVLGIDALSDPVAAKQITAWVSDEPMIYDKLTPLEYLEFVAGLWGIDPARSEPSARELLSSLGLEPHLHERCEGFSKGMRQKVALAGALVHDPRLIILDEPLTGLDALSARHVKGLLQDRVRTRLHRDHDHAYPRSGRAHGRPHRRDRGGPAGRRGHAGRTAPAERHRTTPASKTCSSRWSMPRPRRHDIVRGPDLVRQARNPAGMARRAGHDDRGPALSQAQHRDLAGRLCRADASCCLCRDRPLRGSRQPAGQADADRHHRLRFLRRGP